ncbi:MAG: ATP-binding protein [Bacteroides sp.]|nr:ATP-binding protein [Barnesiella sp.]MBD5315378.1 ATP-binding protein [Bacteroides sp.]
MNTNPWKIKSISIDGLLGQHNLFWELNPTVNIIGGPNGSGKSTILHALAVLLQGPPSNDSDTEEVGSHCEALFKSLSVKLKSGGKLRISRTVDLAKETIENADQYDSGNNPEKVTTVISYDRNRIVPENLEDSQYACYNIYINSADVTLRKINGLAEQSRKTNRPALTTLDLMLEKTLNIRNQLFAQRLSIAMKENDDNELRKLLNLFGRFEKSVKNFMTGYTILDTAKLIFAPESNDEQKISYYHLSTGEKQLLYLLLTVTNTLEESTILLLDEADLGMHLDWKKKLLRELLTINPNMQIIAATHSPSLIEGWYDNVRDISQLIIPGTQEN